MADNKLTAAEHFANAENLLAQSEAVTGYPEQSSALALRAQAHIDAARFLLDLHIARNTTAGHTAVDAAGLRDLATEKRGV